MAESVQEGSGLQQSLALASTASPRWPLAGVTQKRPHLFTLPKGRGRPTQQVSGCFPPNQEDSEH